MAEKDKASKGAKLEIKKGEVRFRNGVSWAGDDERDGDGKIIRRGFSYMPGQIIVLSEEVALAREEAGLGQILEDEE